MVDPNKMMEAWFGLVTEAARGNNDARETMRALTGSSLRPDEIVRLMTRFMPAGMMPVQAESMNEWLEEYWKTIGVVPRYRYLDLLERYEQLRLRVEELEQSKNMRMPSMMSVNASQPEEAKKVLNMWGTMLEETMKMQQEMLRAWAPGSSSEEGADEAAPAAPQQQPEASQPKEGGSGAAKPRSRASKPSSEK
jgi:hypothetical protein